MKSMRLQSCMLAVAMLVAASPGWAQQTSAPPVPAATSASAKTFSQQDLDQILAPIALYPDALLAQIFMASTYPLEIVEAARWVKANPNVKDKALEDAMQKQTWDPSVKSLTTVPQVLGQMNDKLDWTQKLGDAFLAQQKEVMSTVQSLRAKAKAAGNLESTGQQVVKSETAGRPDDLHNRVAPARRDLCAHLRSDRGVRGVVVSVSAVLHVSASLRLPAGTSRSPPASSSARRSGATATGTAVT